MIVWSRNQLGHVAGLVTGVWVLNVLSPPFICFGRNSRTRLTAVIRSLFLRWTTHFLSLHPTSSPCPCHICSFFWSYCFSFIGVLCPHLYWAKFNFQNEFNFVSVGNISFSIKSALGLRPQPFLLQLTVSWYVY